MMDDKAHWDDVADASELLRDGDHKGARQALRAALDRDPRNPYAHFFLGASHFESGEFEAAREAYEAAVARAPKYLGAIVGLGHSLRMLNRVDDAIRTGTRAQIIANEHGQRNDPDVDHLLGLCWSAAGNAPKAIEYLERFVASNPEVEARYEVEALLETLRGKAKAAEPA